MVDSALKVWLVEGTVAGHREALVDEFAVPTVSSYPHAVGRRRSWSMSLE